MPSSSASSASSSTSIYTTTASASTRSSSTTSDASSTITSPRTTFTFAMKSANNEPPAKSAAAVPSPYSTPPPLHPPPASSAATRDTSSAAIANQTAPASAHSSASTTPTLSSITATAASKSSQPQQQQSAQSAPPRPPSPLLPHQRGFFSFLRTEFLTDDDESNDAASATNTAPSQLVYNFLILPWYLERLLTLGFMICLDCFLHLFTILPCRMVLAGMQLMRSILAQLMTRTGRGVVDATQRRRPLISGAQLCDLCRGLLLLACWYGLAYINMSRLYHYIRGQSVLKLYVIFNMLQISDRLFCSFGEDILESLFGSCMILASSSNSAAAGKGKPQQPATSKSVQALHVLFHFAISVLYVFGHSLLLFAQVITLNVSVNSDNSSLFVVLVSNNFIELKGAVFKRFDHHNLMQISASDIVERFQLTIFLLVIMIQNLAHIGLAFASDWLEKAGIMCFMVLGGEWIVDWIKHGFITKFNGIPPVVYRHFGKVLCTDFLHTHKHKTEASIHSVSRRLGLPSLPIAVLVIRVASSAFTHSPSHILVKSGLLLSGFICLALLKCLLSILLLGHAARRVMVEPHERAQTESLTHVQALKAATRAPNVKSSPSQNHSAGLPKSPPYITHPASTLVSPLPPLHSVSPPIEIGNPPPHPSAPMFSRTSSTCSSPSMFTAANLSKFPPPVLAMPPPALEFQRQISQVSSGASTPGRTPGRTPLDTPLDTTRLRPSSTSERQSPVDFDRGSAASPDEDQSELDDEVVSIMPPQLSVRVTDVDGSPQNNSLTARFGHIKTPTALERFGSNVSPEPRTPQMITMQTVTLQLDNSRQHHTNSNNNALSASSDHSGSSGYSSQPVGSDTVTPSWPELTRVTSSHPDNTIDGTSTSSISVVSSSMDQVEIVEIPQSNESKQNGEVPIAALHIYHHQVPQNPSDPSAVPTSAGSSFSGADPQQQTQATSYAPTVVTINSSSVTTEKAAPSYDDAQKMEQDLLLVQRYKISANKAIPV